MRSTVIISGASDDLIEVEGACSGCDEYNAEDATFLLSGVRDGELATAKVRVTYTNDGVWAINVAQEHEGRLLLACVIDSGNPAGYTVQASFDDVDSVARLHDGQ